MLLLIFWADVSTRAHKQVAAKFHDVVVFPAARAYSCPDWQIETREQEEPSSARYFFLANTRFIGFYSGEEPDHRGRYLHEIQEWPDDQLEAVHDFIQLAFPITRAERLQCRSTNSQS